MVNMQTRNDQTTQALQLLREILQRFFEQGVTEQELTDAKIEAVTVDMIKETFKRRLHLDKLVTVTVGGESNSNGQTVKPSVPNSHSDK